MIRGTDTITAARLWPSPEQRQYSAHQELQHTAPRKKYTNVILGGGTTASTFSFDPLLMQDFHLKSYTVSKK
jgi:hypothetical protein